MDPEFITAADWAQIPAMLVSLYAFVGAMIVFAFSLMLYVAVIPSMVGTHHLPARAASYRPVFLGLSVLFFLIAAGIFLNFAINQSGAIYRIYDKVWI